MVLLSPWSNIWLRWTRLVTRPKDQMLFFYDNYYYCWEKCWRDSFFFSFFFSALRLWEWSQCNPVVTETCKCLDECGNWHMYSLCITWEEMFSYGFSFVFFILVWLWMNQYHDFFPHGDMFIIMSCSAISPVKRFHRNSSHLKTNWLLVKVKLISNSFTFIPSLIIRRLIVRHITRSTISALHHCTVATLPLSQ